MHYVLALLFTIILSSGCLATNKEKKEDKRINELQLQEEIQRFYTRFTESIIESGYKDNELLKHNNTKLLQQYLLYDSEALKIATSPYPVVNLLDMMVFVKLNRMVLQDYWIPHYYGKSGKVLLDAFVESEKDIEHVATKVLNPKQMHDLNDYVNEWRGHNTDMVRVEKIRFGDFAKYAKDYSEPSEKKFSLVDTQSAVKAVDQMVLVANRGIFLAQHMPFILRLHTRLGAQEIIADTLSDFNGAQMMEDMEGARPLVENLTELTKEADYLAKDVRAILSETKQKHGLTRLESLLDKSTLLLRELKAGRTLAESDAKTLKSEFHNTIWFIAFVIIFVGLILALIWWGGYYLTRRQLRLSEK